MSDLDDDEDINALDIREIESIALQVIIRFLCATVTYDRFFLEIKSCKSMQMP